MVRRGYDGIFHHVSAEHLDRYVNEFARRHNVRYSDTPKFVPRKLHQAENFVDHFIL